MRTLKSWCFFSPHTMAQPSSSFCRKDYLRSWLKVGDKGVARRRMQQINPSRTILLGTASFGFRLSTGWMTNMNLSPGIRRTICAILNLLSPWQVDDFTDN